MEGNSNIPRPTPPDDAGIQGAAASSDLFQSGVYAQLKAIAHVRMVGERDGHLLSTTALVHEALLKLTQDGQLRAEDRPEFFRSAAAAMRQILIDHARGERRQKRGGGRERIELNDNAVVTATRDPDLILSLDEAISRLEQQTPDAAAVVRLRFFGGLSVEETAEALATSPRSVNRLWSYARAWLWRELNSSMASVPPT